MRKKLNNAIKTFIKFIIKHFHFFHSYEPVGGKFIGSYFPDFMDEEGLQTYIVYQNAKCNKCELPTHAKGDGLGFGFHRVCVIANV